MLLVEDEEKNHSWLGGSWVAWERLGWVQEVQEEAAAEEEWGHVERVVEVAQEQVHQAWEALLVAALLLLLLGQAWQQAGGHQRWWERRKWRWQGMMQAEVGRLQLQRRPCRGEESAL